MDVDDENNQAGQGEDEANQAGQGEDEANQAGQGEDEAELDLSQNANGKIWTLKDCLMEVGSLGKKSDTDSFMTVDLVFRLDGSTTPIVVGK